MNKKAIVLLLGCALFASGCSSNGSDLNLDTLDFYPLDDGTYAVGAGKLKFLSKITIPDTHNGKTVSTIARDGFEDCANLREIVLPSNLKVIEYDAFYNCSYLETVKLPNSLEKINTRAFLNCTRLTNISIPANVALIENNAFSNCGLTKISFANNSKLEIIGKEAFYSNNDLESIKIPSGVTVIPYQMCCYCESLKSVELPDTLMSIESSAFSYCEKLTSITYKGTKSEWKAISKDDFWCDVSIVKSVKCSDGSVTLTE